MNIFALFALSFLPLIVVFFLFVILVPGQKKVRFGILACILGLFAVVPTSLVQHFILNLPIFTASTVVNLLVTAIIFNGLIEESVKMFFLSFLPFKKLNLSFYFCCALLAGMTLGSFESIIYVVKKISGATEPLGTQAVLNLLAARAFTSVLIHTFCAGLSGLYLWMFKKKTDTRTAFCLGRTFARRLQFFCRFFKQFLLVCRHSNPFCNIRM